MTNLRFNVVESAFNKKPLKVDTQNTLAKMCSTVLKCTSICLQQCMKP